MRYHFALILVLSIFSSGFSQSRPNIILIMADDMGYECLSSNGALSYNTPVLDRLAMEGMRFTRCHSQPLCTPSRVKIMTGRYNFHNYLDFGYLDVNERTFGNVLKEAGYATVVAGKWQLNGRQEWPEWQDRSRPHHFGFDEYCLWHHTQKGPRYPKPYLEQNGKVLKTTLDDYGPDIVSNYILDFIERKKDESFFVYYPMILVHDPFKPTPDSPEWQDPERRNEKDDRYFKDMVEYTDKIIGQIDQKLAELNIRENTLLIFTGDNGTKGRIITQTANGPYKGGKGSTPDAGNHVPMIMNWPQQMSQGTGKIYDGLLEFNDILPTLAEVAGASIPSNIDGRSLYPLLTNQGIEDRDHILIHYDPKRKPDPKRPIGRFVRNEIYKLYTDDRFYHIPSDKLEKDPLADAELTEQQKNIKSELQAVLDQYPKWDYTQKTQYSIKIGEKN